MTTLVTGGTGMVGTNIKDMIDVKVSDFVFLSSKDGDLRCLDKVKLIFERYKPKFVIHLAANVGGLYKNMNHNVEMFRDNIRIGNYLIYNKIEGFTPKHPNIFNQYKDIQLLFEKLIDLVIDTTINCKWKNRDWNINNVIVDKNNKFHLIDLDSVTDNYYYENVIASVNRWDINGVRVDNHLRNRLKILENV